MNDENWEALDKFDDELRHDIADEMSAHQRKSKGKARKRKWREIETIKEQRRLRRDMDEYEQYSY